MVASDPGDDRAGGPGGASQKSLGSRMRSSDLRIVRTQPFTSPRAC